MDNKQQLNSIRVGAYFPIKLTTLEDDEGNPILVPKLEVVVDEVSGKSELKPVLKPKRDENGNIIYQRDENGNLISDSKGEPIALMEPEMVPKVTWHPLKGDPSLIKQNLVSLVAYNMGYRMREENFGTRLWECIEEPNDADLEFLVSNFILESVSTWEPRITALDCKIKRDFDKLLINLQFVLEGSTSVESLDFNINPQELSSYVTQ